MDRADGQQFSQLAGDCLLEGQTTEQRRQAGRVFTPPALVDFILATVGYTASSEIERAPILDPACGTGAFLEQVVIELARASRRAGRDLRSLSGHRHLQAMVSENVWGIDVDARSCALARQSIARRVETLTGRPALPGFMSKNLLALDFLLEDVAAMPVPVRDGRISYIIGNPPYVSATRIPPDYKARLRSRFTSAEGRLDLYTLFIERCLELLPNGGRLGIVTPDKYLTSYSASGVRRLIANSGAVKVIARFSSHKIFQGAATVPCVTVLERGGVRGSVAYLSCEQREDGQVTVSARNSLPDAGLSAGPWQIQTRSLTSIAARLRAAHPTLESVCERISAGPATGRDGVFLLDTSQAAEVEAELLRPALRGRDIDAYSLRASGLSLLVPFVYAPDGTARLIDLRDFPRAARYLAQHRQELEARHCVREWGKTWYDFHDQPAGDLARKVKVVVPDVADSNRFALDAGHRFPLHSAYYLLPREGFDAEYLVGVLNSSVASLLVRAFAPRVKDGFSRYRQQFLKELPIPTAHPSTRRLIAQASTRGDHSQVDELVYGLFALNAKSIREVRARLEDLANARAA